MVIGVECLDLVHTTYQSLVINSRDVTIPVFNGHVIKQNVSVLTKLYHSAPRVKCGSTCRQKSLTLNHTV